MKKLSPIVSEFETQEEAEAYDRWFRARVEKSLADKRPGVPHDEAMARYRGALRQERANLAEWVFARGLNVATCV